MGKKTVPFTDEGIGKLPDDKPAVYRILTPTGRNNYTGSAGRGNLQDRLRDHLPGGPDYVPGAKVQIDQAKSIAEARKKEAGVIARVKPKYNKAGK